MITCIFGEKFKTFSPFLILRIIGVVLYICFYFVLLLNNFDNCTYFPGNFGTFLEKIDLFLLAASILLLGIPKGSFNTILNYGNEVGKLY